MDRTTGAGGAGGGDGEHQQQQRTRGRQHHHSGPSTSGKSTRHNHHHRSNSHDRHLRKGRSREGAGESGGRGEKDLSDKQEQRQQPQQQQHRRSKSDKASSSSSGGRHKSKSPPPSSKRKHSNRHHYRRRSGSPSGPERDSAGSPARVSAATPAPTTVGAGGDKTAAASSTGNGFVEPRGNVGGISSPLRASAPSIRLSAPEDTVALEMPEYDSPDMRKQRVTSSRSRMEGRNPSTGFKWVIHSDTPGGHTTKRMRLVKGIEFDEHEYDSMGDLVVEPGLAPATLTYTVAGSSQQKQRSASLGRATTTAIPVSPGLSMIPEKSLRSKTSDAPPEKPERSASNLDHFSDIADEGGGGVAAIGAHQLLQRQFRLQQQQQSESDSQGDSTLKDSAHLPMSKPCEDMYQSRTWDTPDEFDLSDTDASDEDPSQVRSQSLPVAAEQQRKQQSLKKRANNNKQISAAVSDTDDSRMLGRADDEDDEEDDDEKEGSYIQNYGYATSPTPRMPAKSSLKKRAGASKSSLAPGSHKSNPNTRTTDEEQSIDPMAGFKPYENQNPAQQPGSAFQESSSMPVDSLADIEDSFACDYTGTEAAQQQKLGANNNQLPPLTSYQQEPSLGVPTPQISSQKRATPALRGSNRDSSSRFTAISGRRNKPDDSAHTSKTGGTGPSRGVGRSKSVDSGLLSSPRVGVTEAMYGQSLANPSSPAGRSGKAQLHGSKLSRNSHDSQSSESSSSAYSFGLHGRTPASNAHSLNPYRVPDEHDVVTPFMQFNLQATDGVQVVSTNDEVSVAPGEADTEGPSVREFSKSDLPPFDDPMGTQTRQSPRRKLEQQKSSRRNIRLGIQRHSSNREKQARQPPVRTSSKDGDIVKRFFSFANSSFGSLASSGGELLGDDDDDDMIFE